MSDQHAPWTAIPVPDEEYDDLDALLGFDRFTCSTCGAKLRGGICLNACHLGVAGQRRFQDAMRRFVAGRTGETQVPS